MKKVFKLKSFWLVIAVAIGAIFLLFVNSSRTYQSETELLIIPKSVTSVNNANQIIENIRQLPSTLSFYKRMIADNPDVANATIVELPDYKQKVFWNSELEVVRIGMSGEIRIISHDKDSYQAGVLSSQATKSLIGIIGQYYDIKNDLDIRVIDPTITGQATRSFPFLAFVETSLGICILIFLLFLAILSIFEFENFKTPAITQPKLSFQYKNPLTELLSNRKAPTSPTELPVNDNLIKDSPLDHKATWTPEEKPYTAFAKTASAPANLPIADDALTEKEPPVNSIENVPSKAEPTPVKTAPIIREATAEEVKERLNKLLSGKL